MNDHSTTTTTGSEPDTLAADDPRRALAGAVRTARTAIAAVTPEQWDRPTPCDAMTVRDLLEHLVMVNRRIAMAGRSVPTSQWPIDAADVAAGGWLDAFTDAAHDIQVSWPDEGLTADRQLPWGTFPGDQVLAVYANELTVHTWDLARATGQQPEWDDEVLDASWSAIRLQLPDAVRGPMWAQARQYLPEGVVWEDPFADAVDVAPEAPLIDRLVAWNGRTP